MLTSIQRATAAARPDAAGVLLGRVGSSGNSSSEPHLQFHVQDGPMPLSGTGLPVRFRDVVVDGRRRRAAAALQGSFIAARCERTC